MSLLPLALQAIREGEGSPAYQALSEAAAQGDRPYPYIIAVDFDGTLCENNWPEIGRENWKMLKVLPLLRKLGVLLVLWSCREEDDLADAIIEAGMQSKAQLFIMQMQDYLRLGRETRMNEPGRLLQSNWRWRMLPGAANETLAKKIAGLTERSNRV